VLEGDTDAVERNSSGKLLPHTEVRLVNGDAVDVPTGDVGEIWVRGPSITPGYWNRPRADFFDGDWFKTGDCARRDAEGHYYIVDRLKEVYRSGGENVYPAEVEAVLAQVPDVLELAIVGVPDQRWGEVGLAVVVPRPGATVSLETLTDFASGKLARFKLPKHIEVVDELPRNVTAKVARDELRRAYCPC
jgi:fatty-acyl-CoA synthase